MGGRAVTYRIRGEAGSPPAHSKPAFPVPFLEECVSPAWEETHLLLFLSNSTRKIPLIGFKNRTLELDFYGL